MAKSKKMVEAVGLACQIVYEYENWNDEHVDAMMQTFADCGDRPPCSGDTLQSLCHKAAKLKKEGKTFQQAEEELTK